MLKLKNAFAAVAVLLVACGQTGSGGGSADAKEATGTGKKLEVAQLAIGMTIAEATSILKASDWRVAEVPKSGFTWAQEVNNKLYQQKVPGRTFDYPQAGVGLMTATKGDEQLEVEFRAAPPPRLGVVKEVRYKAPAPGQTAEKMIADLSRRYGAPDRNGAPGYASGATWCVAGPACAKGRGFGTRTILLGGQFSTNGGLMISLIEGGDASAAWDAELLKATGTAAGTRGKPSY
jgi:hypothetical protein